MTVDSVMGSSFCFLSVAGHLWSLEGPFWLCSGERAGDRGPEEGESLRGLVSCTGSTPGRFFSSILANSALVYINLWTWLAASCRLGWLPSPCRLPLDCMSLVFFLLISGDRSDSEVVARLADRDRGSSVLLDPCCWNLSFILLTFDP